jgi:hypothetical protein
MEKPPEEFNNVYASSNILVTAGDEIKEDTLGRISIVHGRNEKCIQNFIRKT